MPQQTPPTPPNNPDTVTKKMVIQRRIAGFRPHEAWHVSDNAGKNNPKRGSSRVLGVLDFFYHFDSQVDFAPLNKPLLWGVYRDVTPLGQRKTGNTQR